ncbi:sensor histidine kinase [Hyunsoonleella pacifica]|uniref:histidine kinase n=1 Tax=Hyunsoonleella pacifica TaxID=1080224 RepID=A0A4V2JB63_9FLAO|nr:HAMP domain-containing sensor histidine kinase [Hyunsoonleella pacifica]TBN17518.1 PAS domain S-box protein [Hyunsoonleella pacifica]
MYSLQPKKETLHLSKMVEEIATIGTWEVDLNTNKLMWSDVTKKIHEVPSHYTPNVKSGIEFYKEGENRERITSLFKELVEHNTYFDEEFEIVTAKGNRKWVRSIGVIGYRRGSTTRVAYGTFQDVTEKTNFTRQISISEEQFRKIFEFSETGIALIDLNEKWLRINQHFCDMLGYTENELKKLPYYKLVYPEDLERNKKEFTAFLKGESQSFSIQKRFVHKNGGPIWTLITRSAVKDNLGNTIHYVLHAKNINDDKLQQIRIEKLLDISRKQNDKLLNFAHIVSHNLRSHYSNLQMLLNDIKLDDSKLANTSQFELMRMTIDNLGETIHNLNDTVDLSTKHLDGLKTVNIKKHIDNTIISIKPSIKQSNAIIRQNVDKSIEIRSIPAYIDSIFLNILNNAVKYKSPKRQLVIDINAKIENEYVIIQFRDNGLGIDLDLHKNKIFGMYKTFHDVQNANGLGLYITKNQIDYLGGDITVESKVDVGSSFYIKLKK